uniref:Syntaxin 12, like n=1 Tax=Salmo trutta TaxID=8032 RepID=A0A674A8E4_SALTR
MSYGRTDSYHSQPRDFSNLTQTCSVNIQKITLNTGQIKNMLYQMGTRQETPELQDRLQQVQHYTNQLAKETNRHLKDLGSLPLPPSEQRQQKIQKDRLMNDFSAALNNFQAVQRRAAEKERESVARARAGSRLTQEDEGNVDEQLVTFEKDDDDWSQTQQLEEPEVTEEDLEVIKERETNIRQLEVLTQLPAPLTLHTGITEPHYIYILAIWHIVELQINPLPKLSSQRRLVGGDIGGQALCNGWNGINGTVSNTSNIWKPHV